MSLLQQNIPIVHFSTSNKIRINPISAPYLLSFIFHKWACKDVIKKPSSDTLSINMHCDQTYVSTLLEKMWKKTKRCYNLQSISEKPTSGFDDIIAKKRELECVIMETLPGRKTTKPDELTFYRAPLFTIEYNEVHIIYIMSLEVLHVIKDDYEDFILISNTSLGPVMKRMIEKEDKRLFYPLLSFLNLWLDDEITAAGLENIFKLDAFMKKETQKSTAKFLISMPFVLHLQSIDVDIPLVQQLPAFKDIFLQQLEYLYSSLKKGEEDEDVVTELSDEHSSFVEQLVMYLQNQYSGVAQTFLEHALPLLGKRKSLKRARKDSETEGAVKSVKN